jgi:hypothetical protein
MAPLKPEHTYARWKAANRPAISSPSKYQRIKQRSVTLPLAQPLNDKYPDHYWIEPIQCNTYRVGASIPDNCDQNPCVFEELADALLRCNGTVYKHYSNLNADGSGDLWKTLYVGCEVHLLTWQQAKQLLSPATEDDLHSMKIKLELNTSSSSPQKSVPLQLGAF